MDLWDKIQKRHEINKKIGELQDKISRLERIRNEIEIVKQEIDREWESWNKEYNVYKKSSLAEEIMLVNHFEGLAAEQLAANFPSEVAIIDGYAGKTSEISGRIGSVLVAIDAYIVLLNAKIAGLRNELAALD